MKVIILSLLLILLIRPKAEAAKLCGLIEIEGEFSFQDKDILFIANKKSESEIVLDIKNKNDIKIKDLQQPYYFIQFEVLPDCHSEIKCAVRFKSIIKRYHNLADQPKDFQIFQLYQKIENCKKVTQYN